MKKGDQFFVVLVFSPVVLSFLFCFSFNWVCLPFDSISLSLCWKKKSTLTLRKEGHRSPFLVNCMTFVYRITRKSSWCVCPCTLRCVNEHRRQTAGDRHATD